MRFAVASVFALAIAPLQAAGAARSNGQRPRMNKSPLASKRADLLLSPMTLDKKTTMVRGVARKEHPFVGYGGYVPTNRRLGIPALRPADGWAGVGNHATNVSLRPEAFARPDVTRQTSEGMAIARGRRAIGDYWVHENFHR